MRVGPTTPAIVTGGASGLGAACVRRLRAAGAPVAILDRDVDRGEALASEVGANLIATDVADDASMARAIADAAEAHGSARIAVACAGVAPGSRSVGGDGAPHDAALFRRVIEINLIGVFNLATCAAAAMAGLAPIGEDGERGVIVTTSSIAAEDGQVGQLAYAASKGGVASMTLPMARDLARSGVRVVSIAPGLFMTPMLARLSEDVVDSLTGQTLFPKRFGDPAEFAGLALHVVENPMLNGTLLRLDGGVRMGPR